MQGSTLEQRLRSLPGVLDCSLNEAGVALLVHPEVDARVLKARAQAMFAELGDPRPLVLVGGLAPATAISPRRFVRLVRGADPTPLSLSVFAILVLCLLALMPLSSDEGGRSVPSAAPTLEGPLAQAAVTSELAADLFRPVGSFARRARLRTAAVVAVPAPATTPPAADDKPRARPTRPHPRPQPRVAAQAPVLIESATMVAARACAPGRSGEQRHRPKKPNRPAVPC